MAFDTAPRRLHPASILFNLARDLKAFAVPALLVAFGARGTGSSSFFWALAMAVPAAIGVGLAVFRYLSFVYIYEEDELVVRSGVFFKRERHIPYSRIQNIDATQNVAHRLLSVYHVALETGSGAEAEATMSVLPGSALAEMRQRVFEGRHAAAAAERPADIPAPIEPAQEVLIRMGLRDLALCGLVRGRGLLLLGAIVGVLFDFGLDDAITDSAENPQSRGPIVRALRSLFQGVRFDPLQLLVAGAVFAALVLMLRLFSMIYTMQRLYGFTLTLAGGELRMTYGSLTRIGATIPVRRIQTLTMREGPLHRLFGVCSVRADTAGGEANVKVAGSREWLAPIITKEEAARFIRRLMPEAEVEAVAWRPAHPRALRRALVKPLVYAGLISLVLAWNLGIWAAPAAAILLAAAVIHARRRVRHMGHALAGDVFLFKSGAFWRHVTVAPLRKVQAVAVRESPFDRRHRMARLHVDTAGAAGSPHRLNVPYLDRDSAGTLATAIAGSAAQSPLSW